MNKFTEWYDQRLLREDFTVGPEVVNIIHQPGKGIWLQLASGKNIGPVSNIQAQQGDQTHSNWIVTSTVGQHAVTINPQKATAIVSNFFKAKKKEDEYMHGSTMGLMGGMSNQQNAAYRNPAVTTLSHLNPEEKDDLRQSMYVKDMPGGSKPFTHEDYARYRTLKNAADSGTLTPKSKLWAELQALEKAFQDAVKSGNLPA